MILLDTIYEFTLNLAGFNFVDLKKNLVDSVSDSQKTSWIFLYIKKIKGFKTLVWILFFFSKKKLNIFYFLQKNYTGFRPDAILEPKHTWMIPFLIVKKDWADYILTPNDYCGLYSDS